MMYAPLIRLTSFTTHKLSPILSKSAIATAYCSSFGAVPCNNGLQIDGKIDDVCSPYPIDEKFAAFNFHVECAAAPDSLTITGPVPVRL